MRTDFANHLQTARIACQTAVDFIEVFGAPEEIRTPDPQIRSLVQVIENTHVLSKLLCLVPLNFNGLGFICKPNYSVKNLEWHQTMRICWIDVDYVIPFSISSGCRRVGR